MIQRVTAGDAIPSRDLREPEGLAAQTYRRRLARPREWSENQREGVTAICGMSAFWLLLYLGVHSS